MKLYRLKLLIFSWLLVVGDLYASERWYSEGQVSKGKETFTQNCAVCHGGQAEATSNWMKTGPDGNYPPPPLNGTAHAWHHPKDILRRQIMLGGVPLGGTMPPFKDILSLEEIDNVIAYFQNFWSDEIYALWKQRDTEAGQMRMVK